jgi:hypothetical protein
MILCPVTGVCYKTGDYVFVKPGTKVTEAQSTDDVEKPDVSDYWVAKILEIRAEGEESVYARVCTDSGPSQTVLTLS